MLKGWLIFNMIDKFIRFVFGLLLLMLLVACQKEQTIEPLRFVGKTMGTTWSVVMVPTAGIDHEGVPQALQLRLDQINHLMSTYDPTSEVSRFNQQQSTDWFTISDETARVIDLSLEVSRLTSGAFDISVGPLVDLWGFGPSERGTAIPDQDQVEQRMSSIGYDKLELRLSPGAIKKKVGSLRIDLSAVAKGYAVDELAALLKQKGINNYLVEVGGELQVSGFKLDGNPWRIAIEKPLEGRREVETVIPLTGTALATSGNYRNFFIDDGQRYAHTIDPVLGRPIRHKLASATVLDPSCARADALATALMVLGEEKGRILVEKHQIPAYFLIHQQDKLVDFTSSAFKSFVEKVKP
jgi:FAD:protein FMN transferase